MFLHLDLDSFFASAHMAIDDGLIGKPVAVGSRSNLDIFELQNDTKQQNLTHSMHKLREKFGLDIIKSGGEL